MATLADVIAQKVKTATALSQASVAQTSAQTAFNAAKLADGDSDSALAAALSSSGPGFVQNDDGTITIYEPNQSTLGYTDVTIPPASKITLEAPSPPNPPAPPNPEPSPSPTPTGV